MKAKFPIFILIVVVIVGEMSKDPDNPPPRMAPRAVGEKVLPPLPDASAEGAGVIAPASPRDSVIQIEDAEKGRRQQYTGTAFSIDGRGLWVTARHVTHGCDQLALLRPFSRPIKVDSVVEHVSADVSIIRTDGGIDALPIDYSTPQYDQEGFHFGFPRGDPGAVYSKLIGRRTIKSTGTRTTREPVLVWAEKIRIPDSNESLGGISGGPILNGSGSVVGVHIAGSIRRGRSFSSLPSKIDDILDQSGVQLTRTLTPVDVANLNSVNFGEVGNNLREELTVAQVVCRTD